jgi:hypothetical protein
MKLFGKKGLLAKVKNFVIRKKKGELSKSTKINVISMEIQEVKDIKSINIQKDIENINTPSNTENIIDPRNSPRGATAQLNLSSF